MDTRPTRWQKTRQDWHGFQWRDLWIAFAGLAVAVGVLALLDFPGKTMIEVAIVAGSGVLAAVLYTLSQLVWAWLQAPMRLLTEDVIAIRERLEAIPPTPPEPPFDMRYSLLNSIRLGDQLNDLVGGAQRFMPPQAWEQWATPVIALLTEHADRADAEEFLEQRTLPAQLDVLRQLLEKYPPS